MKAPKRCPGCGEADLAKFGVNRRSHDGLQSHCRDCGNARLRARRAAARGPRTCRDCGEADLAKFGVNRRSHDGLHTYCLDCQGRRRQASRARTRPGRTIMRPVPGKPKAPPRARPQPLTLDEWRAIAAPLVSPPAERLPMLGDVRRDCRRYLRKWRKLRRGRPTGWLCCRTCGEPKPPDAFNADCRTGTGRSNYCRDCEREPTRKSRARGA